MADTFATELLNMVNFTTEHSPNIPGVDRRVNGEAVIRDAIVSDAEFFMSMDPLRLDQEFSDQIKAAALVHDDEMLSDVEYVQGLVAPGIWTGDAAQAFHRQMSHIKSFVEEQQGQARVAAQAAGMMLAVSGPVPRELLFPDGRDVQLALDCRGADQAMIRAWAERFVGRLGDL